MADYVRFRRADWGLGNMFSRADWGLGNIEEWYRLLPSLRVAAVLLREYRRVVPDLVVSSSGFPLVAPIRARICFSMYISSWVPLNLMEASFF
jgi:hypothetical protein